MIADLTMIHKQNYMNKRWYNGIVCKIKSIIKNLKSTKYRRAKTQVTTCQLVCANMDEQYS